ncbi:hypothetical protein A2U01_0047717, partial [Trifolium medium]|nr:hypothetical protein [Trifolium medium]
RRSSHAVAVHHSPLRAPHTVTVHHSPFAIARTSKTFAVHPSHAPLIFVAISHEVQSVTL